MIHPDLTEVCELRELALIAQPLRWIELREPVKPAASKRIQKAAIPYESVSPIDLELWMDDVPRKILIPPPHQARIASAGLLIQRLDTSLKSLGWKKFIAGTTFADMIYDGYTSELLHYYMFTNHRFHDFWYQPILLIARRLRALQHIRRSDRDQSIWCEKGSIFAPSMWDPNADMRKPYASPSITMLHYLQGAPTFLPTPLMHTQRRSTVSWVLRVREINANEERFETSIEKVTADYSPIKRQRLAHLRNKLT